MNKILKIVLGLAMFTKEQQLKWNKKPKITNEDKKYLNWLQNQNYPCFVCYTYSKVEWHHVKNKSTDKKQHDRLIPLCDIHHRISAELSAHGNPKNWRQTFSLQEQLDYSKMIHDEYLNEQI